MASDQFGERIPKSVGVQMVLVAVLFDLLRIFFGFMLFVVGLVITVLGEGASAALGIIIPVIGAILGTAVTSAVGLSIFFSGVFFSFIFSLFAFLTFLMWFSFRKVSFFDRGVGARAVGQLAGFLVPFTTAVSVHYTVRHVQKEDAEYNSKKRQELEDQAQTLERQNRLRAAQKNQRRQI